MNAMQRLESQATSRLRKSIKIQFQPPEGRVINEKVENLCMMR